MTCYKFIVVSDNMPNPEWIAIHLAGRELDKTPTVLREHVEASGTTYYEATLHCGIEDLKHALDTRLEWRMVKRVDCSFPRGMKPEVFGGLAKMGLDYFRGHGTISYEGFVSVSVERTLVTEYDDVRRKEVV